MGALLGVERTLISETRPHMRQVGAGHEHRAARSRLYPLANSIEKAQNPRVAIGRVTARLLCSEPRKNGDDARRPVLEHVLEKHRLKLERVLALVVDLIGVG